MQDVINKLLKVGIKTTQSINHQHILTHLPQVHAEHYQSQGHHSLKTLTVVLWIHQSAIDKYSLIEWVLGP